jgi:radical SAM-linked protein
VRIRFAKGGDLRLVSHHDLMTCFERMLRRAELPFLSSQGFHPKPRLVFALSLALGVLGRDEVVDLELGAALSPEEIHARLARVAPAGLDIVSVRPIDCKTRVQVRSATYRLPLSAGRPADLPERMAALLAAPECWIERSRPQPRRLDLKPYLRDLRLLPDALEMDLWVTPTGTARPDEVLGLLRLGGLLDEGAILERTKLELCEEHQTPGEGQPAPAGRTTAAGQEVDRPPRSRPLIPGPMTYDS